jgi:hypothetical protein
MKSVYVESFTPDLNNLTMVWNENVQNNEMIQAFSDLRSALDIADTPQNVVIILNGHVHFPIADTTLQALPIHRHPMLKSWLVVGSRHSLAKVIADVLSKVSREEKVQWFKSKDDVEQYLRQHDKSYASVQ